MGGVGCWPLRPQGRGKQGWFWASDNHQFWPLLHGDTKPHLAVPGEGPCFFHLSCGQFQPLRNGHRFSLFFSKERKTVLSHGISPELHHPFPDTPDRDRAKNLSCVRAGTTVSKILRLGKREGGTGWGGVAAVPAGSRARGKEVTHWNRVPGEKHGQRRQGFLRTWASSSPASLALAYIHWDLEPALTKESARRPA